ncbi:MAG: RimK/LysX family protein [Pseudomonadota bacterium]
MTTTRSAKSAPKKATLGGKFIIGWREWVRMPELGAPPIKAKIDTGARTSALHAYRIRPFEKNGVAYVEFFIHPVQRRKKPEIRCEAPVKEQRRVTSSTGHSEMRYVIETMAEIGAEKLMIEVTLTNRDQLGFRMLIGREAVRDKFVIDPGRSYCAGRSAEKSYSKDKK